MLSFRLASLQETHSKFQTLKKRDTIQQVPPLQNMLRFSLPQMIKHFLRIVNLWNILMWIKERFQMKMNLRQMVKMSPFQVCLILNWWCPGNDFFYFKCSFQFFIVKLPNKIRFSISINQKLAKALDTSFWTKIIPLSGWIHHYPQEKVNKKKIIQKCWLIFIAPPHFKYLSKIWSYWLFWKILCPLSVRKICPKFIQFQEYKMIKDQAERGSSLRTSQLPAPAVLVRWKSLEKTCSKRIPEMAWIMEPTPEPKFRSVQCTNTSWIKTFQVNLNPTWP